MLQLNSPISDLSRVGKTTAKYLKKLGLAQAQDLLFYVPFRYDDLRETKLIKDLKAGETVTIIGTIELIQNKRSARQRKYLTEALVSDESETIKVIWFNQPFLARNLKAGDQVSLAGKVSDNYGQLSLVSPIYEKINSADLIHTKGLIPRYHLSAGLSQKQIRFLIKQALPLTKYIPDWLPERVRKNLKLLTLGEALAQAHFPKDPTAAQAASQRLNFGDLFLRQLKAESTKNQLRTKQAPLIKFQETATKKFVASLPFKLTDDQRRAAWEILNDLEKSQAMSRLLEGDVGSGKTLVAALALFNTALNAYQGVLMAPTEILASQHFNSLNRLLGGFNVKIGLLTRGQKNINYQADNINPSLKGQAKTTAITKEILDNADIIIGTHALIQDRLDFRQLGLIVVDEQHRFGVVQRHKIVSSGTKNLIPHFLSMTATPIPRSLALAIYGDLDLSLIKQMPAGRKTVITKIISEKERIKSYEFIRRQISEGRQIFVICPLIDESDKSGYKSVKAEHERLDKEIFPDLPVGLLHGRLKSDEKDKVMQDFLDKKTKILVATSVIEVGVDVPNASVMIIEGAERFGLAQLHQFRGRVGRGPHQSYCLLFPSNEQEMSDKSLRRLEALTKYSDGLSLAKIDLKLRGAGDIYGANQSGWPEIKIATLFDYELIKKAKDEAEKIVKEDPELKDYPLLKEKLGQWENEIHFE
ncbi:MAG: ATP-dependent DNA helicase RecG [Patescibacteria group bacterium]